MPYLQNGKIVQGRLEGERKPPYNDPNPKKLMDVNPKNKWHYIGNFQIVQMQLARVRESAQKEVTKERLNWIFWIEAEEKARELNEEWTEKLHNEERRISRIEQEKRNYQKQISELQQKVRTLEGRITGYNNDLQEIEKLVKQAEQIIGIADSKGTIIQRLKEVITKLKDIQDRLDKFEKKQ